MPKASPGEVTPDHAKIEQWLDDKQVEYDYVNDLPLDSIDEAASRNNQARFEALNPETVERYTVAMQHGNVFPPLIGYRSQGKRIVLIAGNHRHAAHKAVGHTTVPMYVVRARPAMLTHLTYEDNLFNGLPPSKEQRLRQAQHLVEATNTSMTSAAEALGLVLRDVQEHMRKIRDAERWRRIGVQKEIEAIGPASAKVARIGQVSTDEAARELAKTVYAANLGTDEVNELVVAINKKKSTKAQVEFLREFRNRPEIKERISDNAGGVGTRRTRARRTPIGQTKSAIGLLNSVQADDAVKGIEAMSAAELEDFQQRIRISNTNLDTIYNAVRRRLREIAE